MRVRRVSIAAACAAPLLALAAAGTTMTASASAPETDTAVLSYTGSGWSCSLVSSNGDSGTCTVTTLSLGISCLGVAQPVRNGAIGLTEPSGEQVQLQLTVVGTGASATFVGNGTDGGAGVTASGSGGLTCRGPFATGGTVSVTWTAA